MASKPTQEQIDAFEYKDMFGRDIKPGDYIVYAGLADRSGVLRAGQVVSLTWSKDTVWSYNRATDEHMTAHEPKVRVKSWNNFRAERSHRDDFEPSGRQKDVVLGFLDRMIVVDESTVSDKVKKDLAGPVADWNGRPIE